jgi:RNA polymerase sigma-70 factor, ECF subfamily
VADHAETADSLSLAFLVLLESLTPVERAVFLLREVFEYPFEEIAAVVGKSEQNCRQIAVRARRQVEAKRPRFQASEERRRELAQRFFDAVLEGDEAGLLELLAADVVVYADAGPVSQSRSTARRRWLGFPPGPPVAGSSWEWWICGS